MITVLGLVVIAAVPATAQASHDSTGAPLDRDFLSGNVTYTANPREGLFRFAAMSGPLGEDPSGSAYFEQFGFFVEGRVTCLVVENHQAVFGFRAERSNTGVGGFLISVTDNGGTRPDTLLAEQANSGPPDCLSSPAGEPSEVIGDIVVHDAAALPTNKADCKSGGWRNFPSFKNQGDCVSFVATGGKNPPTGGR